MHRYRGCSNRGAWDLCVQRIESVERCKGHAYTQLRVAVHKHTAVFFLSTKVESAREGEPTNAAVTMYQTCSTKDHHKQVWLTAGGG
jgi:hypothetical protein